MPSRRGGPGGDCAATMPPEHRPWAAPPAPRGTSRSGPACACGCPARWSQAPGGSFIRDQVGLGRPGHRQGLIRAGRGSPVPPRSRPRPVRLPGPPGRRRSRPRRSRHRMTATHVPGASCRTATPAPASGGEQPGIPRPEAGEQLEEAGHPGRLLLIACSVRRAGEGGAVRGVARGYLVQEVQVLVHDPQRTGAAAPSAPGAAPRGPRCPPRSRTAAVACGAATRAGARRRSRQTGPRLYLSRTRPAVAEPRLRSGHWRHDLVSRCFQLPARRGSGKRRRP